MIIQKAYTDFSNSPAMELDAKRTLLIATDEKKPILSQVAVGSSQQQRVN